MTSISNDLIEVNVDPLAGGRISSLRIAGRERLFVDRSRGPFARPASVDHSFRAMYVRGNDGIPTGELIEPTLGPHDDCFVGPLSSPRVTFDDGMTIELHSDCDHWVVYDEQSHGLCVEPQSGPPNGVNDSPEIVMANSSLRKTFDLTCVGYPQIG